MKSKCAIALSMIGGVALGAAAVEGIRAQATPPTYVVIEVDVQNVDGYMKDYAPKAQALAKAKGARVLALSSRTTQIDGDAPKGRVAIQVWPNMESVRSWQNSSEAAELRALLKNYATARIFAVEGLPQ